MGQQGDAGDQLPRDAEPALGRAGREERRLQRMELGPRREALDRRHVPPVRLGGEHQARVDAPVADEHRARAALPDETALLRAGQAGLVAQDLEQRVVRLDLERDLRVR